MGLFDSFKKKAQEKEKMNNPENYDLEEKLFPISKPWGYSPRHVSEAILHYNKVIDAQQEKMAQLKEALARERNEKKKIDKELKNLQLQLNFVSVPTMSDIQEEYIQNKFESQFNGGSVEEPEEVVPVKKQSKTSILSTAFDNEVKKEKNASVDDDFEEQQYEEPKVVDEPDNDEYITESQVEDDFENYSSADDYSKNNNYEEENTDVFEVPKPKKKISIHNPFGGRPDGEEKPSYDKLMGNMASVPMEKSDDDVSFDLDDFGVSNSQPELDQKSANTAEEAQNMLNVFSEGLDNFESNNDFATAATPNGNFEFSFENSSDNDTNDELPEDTSDDDSDNGSSEFDDFTRKFGF